MQFMKVWKLIPLVYTYIVHKLCQRDKQKQTGFTLLYGNKYNYGITITYSTYSPRFDMVPRVYIYSTYKVQRATSGGRSLACEYGTKGVITLYRDMPTCCKTRIITDVTIDIIFITCYRGVPAL